MQNFKLFVLKDFIEKSELRAGFIQKLEKRS